MLAEVGENVRGNKELISYRFAPPCLRFNVNAWKSKEHKGGWKVRLVLTPRFNSHCRFERTLDILS